MPGTFSILAVVSLLILLCASANPMLIPMLFALELPDTAAAAAVAVASILELSLAVTLTEAADIVASKGGSELRMAADNSLSISLKLNAPVALAAIVLALPLIATLTAIPKPSDSMLEVLSAATTRAPTAVTPESSISATVTFSMLLIVSEKPRPTAVASLWATAMDKAAAPAVELIDELSSAVILTPPTAVTVLPLPTLALVLTRILLAAAEPAPLPAIAEPLPDAPRLPAAPMARANMSAAISAVTVTSPPEIISELSISAQTRLPSPSPPMLLTENAAPIATPVPSPDWLVPTAIPIPPAPLVMDELSAAVTETSPVPRVTGLLRTRATVSKSIRFTEPDAAPAPATPLPDVD